VDQQAIVVSPIRRIDTPVHLSRTSTSGALFVSPAAAALRDKLDQLAPAAATVLIIGETGTGKEVAARHLHARSHRRCGPFIAVNCGALSDSLAEAELFGYEKGAYTGATRTQAGWFEAAHGGTLLLDEIGELSPALQVKLLRVLQEREVTRIGSRTSIPIDVRVIAATNVDLAEAAAAKRFRQDLLFRLNVACVVLPPLRERGGEEIDALALHFVRRYAAELGRSNVSISEAALASLRAHPWPGNIRELENVIHNAMLLTRGDRIERAQLQLRVPTLRPATVAVGLNNLLRPLFEGQMREGEPDLLNRVTSALVRSAFDIAQGNQLRAAEYLGITRHALRTHLSHLGIIRPRRRAVPCVAPNRDRHDLRIGYQPYGTLTLLKVEGSLERRLAHRGVNVTWVQYAAGPQLLEALDSEAVDIGATGEVPPIFAQANGAPLVYVGHDPPSPGGEALLVPRKSHIQCVADLLGKRIALNKGSNVHYLLVQCLEAHGLSLDDVHPVYMPPEEMAESLESGEVDAVLAWDPFLTVALRTTDVRILLDGTGLVDNHQFHVASAEFAARHPDTVNAVLDEVHQSAISAVNDPSKAARSLSDELGIDSSSLEIAIRRLSHGTKPLDSGVIREQQKIADRFYALGLIPRAIAVRDAVWAPSQA